MWYHEFYHAVMWLCLFFRIFLVLLHLSSDVLTITSNPKPNFVLMLADDLGIGDIGCYGNDTIRYMSNNFSDNIVTVWHFNEMLKKSVLLIMKCPDLVTCGTKAESLLYETQWLYLSLTVNIHPWFFSQSCGLSKAPNFQQIIKMYNPICLQPPLGSMLHTLKLTLN